MIPLSGLELVLARYQFMLAIRAVLGRRRRRLSGTQRRNLRLTLRRITGVAQAAGRRRRDRMRTLLRELRSVPCADCGRTIDPDRMELDHVPGRGEKLRSPGECKSRKQLLAEVVKGDFVCCRCHERRELARGRTHSGGKRPCPNAYLEGGCRT